MRFAPGQAPDDVAELARARGISVAVAESLTGGALSSALAAAAGAREWFRGAVVAYSSGVKTDVLGVGPGRVVTEQCAREMAAGVARLHGADLALSTTGVGGPGPDEAEPPGTVIIGWARGPDTGARRFRFSGPPAGVVEQAVAAGVALAVELLGASSDRPGDRDRHPQESEADLNGLIAGLDYPVFVVTAQDDGEQSGCLVGFATQASLDPQRLLVCLSVVNHTYGIARNVDLLGVHVLRSDQHELASLFGGTTEDRTDKFAHCRWERGPGDVPLLSDCAARMVGRVLERIPLGDHVGFLLAPIQVERAADGAALTYQDVKDLRPGHPA